MVFSTKQNPNEEELKDIIEAVDANGGYCPCALEKNEDTKCMCKEFRDSRDVDFCHCGRFYKIAKYETLAVIGNVVNYNDQENYYKWCEMLGYNGFIVLGIPLNLHDYRVSSRAYMDLSKSKIAQSDGVLLLFDNKTALQPILDEMMEWAERLGKRVLTMEDLIK